MKNNMEEVAKLLGVELDEEFEVIFPSDPVGCATVKLTIDGAKVINTNVSNIFNLEYYLLEHLVKGSYGIKRKHWKPKFDEKYYSIGVDGSVEEGIWLSDFLDYSLYKIGNCYSTIEEARANRIKWGKFYDSDEVLIIKNH